MRTAAIHPSDKKERRFHLTEAFSLFFLFILRLLQSPDNQIDLFNKAVFGESCFGVAFKVIDVGGEPDWLPKIKFITDIIQRLEYHTGAGHTVISLADYGIFDQVVILPDLSPHTEHIFLLSDCIRRSGQISLMIPGFLFVKFLNSYEYKGFWLFCKAASVRLSDPVTFACSSNQNVVNCKQYISKRKLSQKTKFWTWGFVLQRKSLRRRKQNMAQTYSGMPGLSGSSKGICRGTVVGRRPGRTIKAG